MIREACTGSYKETVKAYENNAERIELCENLYEGGTTPSYGTVKQLLKEIDIPIFVMIRPRGGDFIYSESEIEIMLEDIRVLNELGVHGFVFGVLTKDNEIDYHLLEKLIAPIKGKEITFEKANERDLEEALVVRNNKESNSEEDFLSKEFEEISIDKIGIDSAVTYILNSRLEEIKKCLTVSAPLSVIFLCGSTLEGILLGIALKYPKQFNQAKAAPKNTENKVKQFYEWTLNDFINVAYELDLLKEDVKKFSHSLREFRNYIHPFQQVSSRFNPDEHTARISWQVLKAAIFQLAQAKI